MKKKLNNALIWFDEMVHSFGLECETATFIHNIFIRLLTNTLEDGCMIWDDEMIEKMYPQAVGEIKRKERERVIKELRSIVNDLNRRLNNGK